MKKTLLSLLCVGLISPLAVAAQSTDCQGKEVKSVKASYTKPVANASADIVDTAVSTGMFKTLVAAVQAAGLVDTLKGPGPFTVFAPTDEAFAKLPAGTVEKLLMPENKAMLVKVLTYHVVPGRVMAADVMKMKRAKTVQGQEVKIKNKKGMVMLDKATVVKADVMADNGIIHVIDTVLMPK